MSSPDERLSDLLAQRARQGSGVHPTREGVGVAVTRRAARRRRKRAVATGLAGLCLVAGVVGGLTLAGNDDSQEDGVTAPTGSLPEVPAVGISVDGFVLRGSTTGLMEFDEETTFTATVFRSGTDLAAPFLAVTIEPPGEDPVDESDRGDAVDIDGDGVDEGRIFTVNGRTALTWPLADSAIAGIAGYHLPEAEILAYGAEIYGAEQPIAELPAPAGLPERSQWTLPSNPAPDQSILTYQGADDASIRVTTTNQPGYFDLLQASSSTYDSDAFETVPLGDSFLGSGRAIVSEPAPGHPYALVLTDSGLTIEISTDSSDAPAALDVHELEDLLAAGAFVEVEPIDGPPTATALAPATTAPVTSTSTVPAPQGLPGVTRTVDERGEHFVIEFDGVPPTLGALTLLETLNGDCARFGDDFERIFEENGDEPYWQGWLTVEIETPLTGIAGPVFGGPALGSAEDPGYILCSDGETPAVIAIPVADLGEPTVTPLSGLPEILIDIPG